MPSPQIYLILGPAGAGRRQVLVDLLTNGLDAAAIPALIASASEPATADDVEQRLAAMRGLRRGPWTMVDGRLAADVPADATHVFLVADGRGNPVDQLEAFHVWWSGTGGELARIITVVDCALGVAHPELLRWYDACVHFSDVVLLNRREGVPNKWVSDFVARYRKQHFPCLIEFVKRGEVANPALILVPEARRISALFDEAAPISVVVTADDSDDDEEGAEGELVDEDALPVDPYIDRLSGSGRRSKEIPDIAKFLSK